MLTYKAGAYSSEASFRCLLYGRLLALHTNIRLGRRGLPGTNTSLLWTFVNLPLVLSQMFPYTKKRGSKVIVQCFVNVSQILKTSKQKLFCKIVLTKLSEELQSRVGIQLTCYDELAFIILVGVPDHRSQFNSIYSGSAISNGREHRSCLGRVFKLKSGSMTQ
jgi:hypothetical protein